MAVTITLKNSNSFKFSYSPYMKIILLILLLMPLMGMARINLDPVMMKMAEALVTTQGADGRFEGTFEADPGFELLSLVLMKKYGQGDKEIEKAFVAKALSWKSEHGFGHYPKAPYSHDVTGLVLISLKALGYDLQQLGLTFIERKFQEKGGVAKLNLGTKILLAPLGLASSAFIDQLTVSMLGLPDALPLSQKKLGIFRSLIIPVTTWNYYRNENLRTHSTYIRTASDKNLAQEGIRWILNHQMQNGTWYTLFHAIVNIAALSEAQKAGLGNFENEIRRALLAIKAWRTKNSRGEITQQLTLTTGWDTPQVLMALSELPPELKKKFNQNAYRSIVFLDKNQIKEKGDWSINSPDLIPGGWSFIVENRDYPDTDVVAAVLEAKLAFPQGPSLKTFDRGLIWLTGLQNKDGGFPAWEKGVSPSTDKLIKTILPKLPDYSDLSQADVTSRIIRLIYNIKKHYPEKDLGSVVQRGCQFIKKSKEKSGPYWKGRWLVTYLYGTAEAIDTLLTTECSTLEEMRPSVEWLVKNQNIDGGFGEAHESFISDQFIRMNSTAMQTSYVVHGLLAFEEKFQKFYRRPSPYKSSLDRALKWLMEKSQQDNWLIKERSFTGVIGAKLWYSDYALSPQFMSLRALGRYSRLSF